MDKIYKTKKQLISAIGRVCKFHERVNNSIETLLKKTGDIEIDDDEKSTFTFCFLDWEGGYEVQAIRLNPDKKNGHWYLDCIDYDNGDRYEMGISEVNGDLIIEQMVFEKALEVYEDMKKKIN